MSHSNVSNLPTKITAKDREKQFPDVLHQSGGKVFYTLCNIVVEHKQKSLIDKHFSTSKHIRRMAETSGPQTRQITVTEAVPSRSVAERMKGSILGRNNLKKSPRNRYEIGLSLTMSITTDIYSSFSGLIKQFPSRY
uniref:Uncharacterized protein n=1 Tax=Amphiprion ocellaris TaxID=80972 RepID=A0AAQ6A312_AMPOC